jgi:hypothetical protein
MISAVFLQDDDVPEDSKTLPQEKKKKKLVTPTNTEKEIGGDTGLCRIGAKWFKYRCMGSLRKTNGVFGRARLDISSTGKVYRDSTTQKTKLQIICLMYRTIFFFVPHMGSSLVQLILVIHSCSHKSEKCRLHLLQIAAGQKIIDNTCLIFQVPLFLYCILLISVSAKLFLSSFLLFLDRVILVLHERTGLRKIYWHGFQMSKMLSFTFTQVQMPA